MIFHLEKLRVLAALLVAAALATSCAVDDEPEPASSTTTEAVTAASVRAVSSGTKAATSGVNTTLSLAAPTGLTTGDLLVAIITNNGGQYQTVATPTGWHVLSALDLWENNTGARTHVFYKIAGAGDTGPFAFASGSVDMAGALYAIANANASAPIAASAGQAHAASTACAAPSITAPANALLLFDCSVAPIASITAPSGFTQRYSLATTGTYKLASEGGSKVQSTAGATGTVTATLSTAVGSVGLLLAIAPASTSTAPTFASETSYPPAAFTPTHTIDVYSQAAFMSAWSNIQAGDQINVHGVTFTGEVVLANKKLTSWAEIHFDSTTKFTGYSSAQDFPDVWIHDDSHIRFYGGNLSQPTSGGMAGGGILVYQCSYITWWNFVVHDVGGTAVSLFPITGPIDHADFKGEVYHWGRNLSWDPHVEKGSGLHGMNIGDNGGGVTNSRIALYAHDGAAGAGIEWGGKDDVGNFQNNVFYAWCQNLTFHAVIQTGGNCMQVWGQNVFDNDIKYLEAENLQGRPYAAGGMYSGQSLATDKVEYGRASNTNLNTGLDGGRLPGVRWDTKAGTVFVDVAPTP